MNIIERANAAAAKAGAPEIYHLIVLLLAYVDEEYSDVAGKVPGTTWFNAKAEEVIRKARSR